MRKKLFATTLCFVLFFFLFNLSTADSSATDDLGRARSVSGKVMLVRSGESMPFSDGAQIQPGDRIETEKSSVTTIVHPDGGTLHVGPATTVTFASLGRLKLTAGTVRVRSKGMYVVALPGSEDVRVSTADSDFAVKYVNRHATILPLSESVFFRGRIVRPGTIAESYMGRAPQLAALTEEDEMNFFASARVADPVEGRPHGYSAPIQTTETSNLRGQASSFMR